MKFLQSVKKLYWRYKYIWINHPFFNMIDKWKLHSITNEVFTAELINLRPKNLEYPIKIRKSFTDKEVLLYVLLDKYHLPVPPINIPHDGLILDLGSNIGLTIAHYKTLYPNLRIIGCEMNIENFKIAQFNIKKYKNVFLENAAVWINNHGVSYDGNANNDSFRIDKLRVPDSEKIRVSSITINKLISKYNIDKIDFLKMDIEGAEVDVLESCDLSWLGLVQAFGMEFHSDEANINKYKKKLENLGFKVWRDKRHWNSILGMKSTNNLN